MKNEELNKVSIEKKSVDVSLKLLLMFVIVGWSVMLVLPFVTPVLWGLILAITLYPLYSKLLKIMRGKAGLASSIITILMLALLLTPAILMISSIIREARELTSVIKMKGYVVPPPDAKVAEWPLVGSKIYEIWNSLSTNLEAAVSTYHEQFLKIAHKLINSIRGLFSNVMMFSLSIILSGVFLAFSEKFSKSSELLSKKLFGENSDEFGKLIIQTIRNVAKGILGVAFIQFVIMGACFMFAGVPYAGLWAIIVFLLALVQLPGAIVAIPVIIYIYSVKDPVPATIWAVVILVCGLSDNVLKPMLMGQGAPVPMIIIFIGAIGGFMLSGFIGLFTGAIVLSLAYKLGGIWIQDSTTE